jgi:hypothetical protein
LGLTKIGGWGRFLGGDWAMKTVIVPFSMFLQILFLGAGSTLGLEGLWRLATDNGKGLCVKKHMIRCLLGIVFMFSVFLFR